MPFGKPSFEVLARTVFHEHGMKRNSVVFGPKPGVDVGVVRFQHNHVLIGSSDPLSYVPRLGPADSGFLSVNAIASDVATSGLAPQYAFFNLNLPPSMSDLELERYWRAIHRSCLELRISILGGHTGRFEGIDYTIVGAGTILSLGPKDGYVTSAMARSGDDLIVTKSAALETAAVLATVFQGTVSKHAGRKTAERAAGLLKDVTTVKDALVARSVGLRTSVTAMHDVTEGGIFSAVLDVASASDLKAVIEADSIPVFDEVREVCKLFRLDPYISLGQGSLLICARPEATSRVLRALSKNRVKAAVIGRLSYKGRNRVLNKHGKIRSLVRHKIDPYWARYWTGIQKGLR